MERRLKWQGEQFFFAKNNGVIIIADAESHQKLLHRSTVEAMSDEGKRSLKVFVFAERTDRYESDIRFMGDGKMFKRLLSILREGGAEVIDMGRDMYVPISSHPDKDSSDRGLLRRELHFFQFFGIRPEELREKVG